MNHIDSYYVRTRSAAPERPPLHGEHNVDVCVIGAGLAGLNTTLELAERCQSVLLLEANRVGFGASGRNGGFIGAGYSQGLDWLTKRVGLDHTQALHALSRKAVATVSDRIERHGIDCGPNTQGVLVSSWIDDPDGIRRYIDGMARDFDVPLEFVPRGRVRDEFADSPRYFDGWLNNASFQFHPLNYCLGIAAAAETSGAKIAEGTPVTGLEVEAAEKQIVTPHALVRARHVVLACGGYDLGVLPEVSGAILPVSTYVMATAPVSENVLAGTIKKPICLADTRDAGDYYRVLPDGRILWGGRMTVRAGDPPRLGYEMLGDLTKVHPQLADHVSCETVWRGTMSYARHRMPQVGRLRDGVWYAQAFGGSGMGTTTVAGDVLGSAIAEGDDRYRLFEPFGLTWAGGPVGRIAAQTTYWSYQVRDWLTARRDHKRRAAASGQQAA